MQFSACGHDPPSSSGKRRKTRSSARIRRTSGRYQVHRHAELEYEPGSNRRVLKNLLGICSSRKMARVEQRELIRTTEWAVRAYGPNHRFVVEDIVSLHRRWLGSIYTWAGDYRQVNVSKGGFLFAAAGRVPHLMEQLGSDSLARNTPLRIGRQPDASLALAETHAELLLIHPFREGNGRLARLLSTLMALQAGIERPQFEVMLERRQMEYYAAVRAGLDRNYDPMRRIFASLIDGGAV
jgi:cell filamentation protein